ncbi:MAG: hypothetical protein PQJ60_07275 [Spirochaetales bacterium]|nr:hypothetical protein [Spirochaetales bacterium]
MKRFTILLLISLSGILWAQSGEYGPADGEERILIAYENTSFKKALVESLIENLSGPGRYIQVVDHSKKELTGLSAADYDAVFITNSGVTAKVRPWVSEWLSVQSGENIIVHTTQRADDWTPQVEVDSVTSASISNRGARADLAATYADLIVEKLGER